jgi:hypothetical protein
MSSLAPLSAVPVAGTPVASSPVTAGPVGSDASATGPPVIDEARAPASVRDGSTAVKQAYASAQGFEEMLLQQLSSSLVQSSGLSAEGESSGEEGSPEGGGEAGMLSSLLPQTLTEGVMRAGGLGLSTQLMGSFDPSASASAAAPKSVGSPGGVSAPASTAVSAPAPTAASNAAAAQTGGVSA